MIHRQHHIGVVEVFFGKQGIGGQWTDDIEPLLSLHRQHRFDNFDFFPPNVTRFSGVGIEPTNQDSWFLQTKLQFKVLVKN